MHYTFRVQLIIFILFLIPEYSDLAAAVMLSGYPGYLDIVDIAPYPDSGPKGYP